jgi:hypothetical protein
MSPDHTLSGGHIKAAGPILPSVTLAPENSSCESPKAKATRPRENRVLIIVGECMLIAQGTMMVKLRESRGNDQRGKSKRSKAKKQHVLILTKGVTSITLCVIYLLERTLAFLKSPAICYCSLAVSFTSLHHLVS